MTKDAMTKILLRILEKNSLARKGAAVRFSETLRIREYNPQSKRMATKSIVEIGDAV